MDVALRTLTGSPAVLIGGEQRRLTPLNFALLVRLRYAEHPVPRSDLARLFWPNAAGRPNLSTALRALRTVLGEAYIPLNDDPIALGKELPADTDLVEAAAKNPTTDAVHAALAAYTAPYLVGLETRLPTTALSEWVVAQRERYRMLLMESVEAAVSGAAAVNAWEQVEALVAAAEERGLTSETLREWRQEAMRRRTAAPAMTPTVPAVALELQARARRRRRLTPFAWIVAVVLIAGSVFALRRGTGDGAQTCRNGEAVAHLVRKEYNPEINNPIGPGRTYSPLWVLRNDGKCTWDATFAVRRVSAFGPHSLNIETDVLPLGREVRPGDTVTIVHQVTAPSTPGDYGENWVLEDGARHPVPVDGRPELLERFQVLPRPLLPCTDAGIRAGYLAASHPDSAVVWPNEAFVATWTVINRGKCIWQPGQVAIRFAGGSGRRMSNPRVMEIRTDEPIRPADAYTFEVPMRAPASGGAVERWSVGPGNALDLALRTSVRTARGRSEVEGGVRECRPGEELVGWLRSERIQDSTFVTEGDTVRKTWTLRNDGECTWAPRSLTLRFHYATHPRENPVTALVLTQAVAPEATYTFSTPLIAPFGQPLYEERWELVNRAGSRLRIGQILNAFAIIKVRPASPAPGSR